LADLVLVNSGCRNQHFIRLHDGVVVLPSDSKS
jgi:hypothetical protein